MLKRRVEEAVLRELVHLARRGGAQALLGDYVPTPRNALVREHYRMLGFKLCAQLAGGGTSWRLALADYRAPDLPIAVVPQGNAAVQLVAAAS